jgi:hypothetical protein
MRYSNLIVAPRNHGSYYTNAKGTFRKVFTDHAVYTKFVITDIIEQLPNLSADVERLLKNQEEIGHLASVSIGPTKGTALSDALKEHIQLAGNVITAIKGGDVAAINTASIAFLDNAESVGRFLNSINPDKLPLISTIEAFKTHSQYVIDIANAQKNRNVNDVVSLYDAYYNHMLGISDAICTALFYE